MMWELVQVTALRPHEQTLAQREEEMYQKISGNQFFHKPLLVDRSTMTILDGHHRHQASLRLGLVQVPAIVMDYMDDESITVEAWPPAPAESVTKTDVIRAAMMGTLMPPKSSCHTLMADIPALEIPLEELRSPFT